MNKILEYITKIEIDLYAEAIKKHLYEYYDEMAFYANMYNEEELNCKYDVFEYNSDFDIFFEEHGEEFSDYLDCVLVDKIRTLFNDIEIENDHLLLYRGISVTNNEESYNNIIESFHSEKEINIGYCWSKDKSVSESFSYVSDKNINSSFLIVSKIHIDNINMDTTVFLNCMGETGDDEKEIRLKENTKVFIDKIEINSEEIEKNKNILELA